MRRVPRRREKLGMNGRAVQTWRANEIHARISGMLFHGRETLRVVLK